MSGTLTAAVAAGATAVHTVVEQPLHGTAAITGNQLTYTPAPGFVGSDTFTTTTATAGADTSAPVVTHVTVNPTTQPPVIDPIDPISAGPTAVTHDVTASAPGSQSLTLAASGLPHGATFQDLGAGHGVITVDPAAGTPGTTTATITATGDGGSTTAPARITIAGNRAPTVAGLQATTAYQTPVVLTAKATDPDGDPVSYSVRTPPAHGTVTNNGPAFTYTPATGLQRARRLRPRRLRRDHEHECRCPRHRRHRAPATTDRLPHHHRETADGQPLTRPDRTLDDQTRHHPPHDTDRLQRRTGRREARRDRHHPAQGDDHHRNQPRIVNKSGTALADTAPTLSACAALTYTLTVAVDRTCRGLLAIRAATASATPDPNPLNNVVVKTVKIA